MAYDTKAQEFAFRLFARGVSKEKALREIRKVYPGFSGSTWDSWIETLGWRERRAELDMKAQRFEELIESTAQTLLLELNEVREKLMKTIREGSVDTQTVYAFTATAKQIAALTEQHKLQQDPRRVSLSALMAAVEKLLQALKDLPGMEKPLEANAREIGALVEGIAQEFGAE